jgi:hypothetical protein
MIDPERNPTNRPLWNPIAGAEAVDDLTVAITTHEPYSALLNTLAHGSGAIVSPAATERYGDDEIATNPVGTGPFILASFNPGQEVVLEAFPTSGARRRGTQELVFRYVPEASTRISALRTGQVDVIDSCAPATRGHAPERPERPGAHEPWPAPDGLRADDRARSARRRPRAPGAELRHPQGGDLAAACSRASPARRLAARLQHRRPRERWATSPSTRSAPANCSTRPAGRWAPMASAPRTESALSFTLYTPEGLFPGDVDIAEVVASSLARRRRRRIEIVKIEAARTGTSCAMRTRGDRLGHRPVRLQPLERRRHLPPRLALHLERARRGRHRRLEHRPLRQPGGRRADRQRQDVRSISTRATPTSPRCNGSSGKTRRTSGCRSTRSSPPRAPTCKASRVWPVIFTIVRDAHR